MKNIIAIAIAGVFAVLLLFGVNKCRDSGNAAEVAAWEVKVENAQKAAAAAKLSADSAAAESYLRGIANAQSIPLYTQGRERIIRLPANQSPETQSAIKACFEIADSRISACEASRKADSVTITKKNIEIAEKDSVIETYKEKPEAREKRLIFFGALGYSVTADSSGTRAAPAFRVGAENKLFGPLRLVTDVQLTMPASGHASPTVQGNVFARLNF